MPLPRVFLLARRSDDRYLLPAAFASLSHSFLRSSFLTIQCLLCRGMLCLDLCPDL